MAGFDSQSFRLRGTALAVAALLTAMLLWALVDSNPYSYYQLLRWGCFTGFLLIARYCHLTSSEQWVWAFCALALLYNPLIPLALGRSIWEAANVGTAVVIAVWIAKNIRTDGGLPGR